VSVESGSTELVVKSTPDNQELCRNLSPVVANVARS
jgi:hypothetical protein